MKTSLRALNAVNFFMADVQGGLGPFLGIYLQEQHWSPAQIGVVMSVGGLTGMAATAPLGGGRRDKRKTHACHLRGRGDHGRVPRGSAIGQFHCRCGDAGHYRHCRRGNRSGACRHYSRSSRAEALCPSRRPHPGVQPRRQCRRRRACRHARIFFRHRCGLCRARGDGLSCGRIGRLDRSRADRCPPGARPVGEQHGRRFGMVRTFHLHAASHPRCDADPVPSRQRRDVAAAWAVAGCGEGGQL